jgi:hypothetical protein
VEENCNAGTGDIVVNYIYIRYFSLLPDSAFCQLASSTSA